MKVFKYPLEMTDVQEVRAPFGMQPLCVQMQDGKPCMWALVNPANGMTGHTVWIHGTGHEVNSQVYQHYVGTFQMHGGQLVFHVFCKPEE